MNPTKITHTLEVEGWQSRDGKRKRLWIRGPGHPGMLGPLWGRADEDGVRVLDSAPDNIKQLVAEQLTRAWEAL